MAKFKDECVQDVVASIETLEYVSNIVVRPSGTEPVVRIMVEGKERSLLYPVMKRIKTAIKQTLNGFN